jgi:hypothetical protein
MGDKFILALNTFQSAAAHPLSGLSIRNRGCQPTARRTERLTFAADPPNRKAAVPKASGR